VVSHLGSVGKDPASAFAGIGPVAAVVFDCMDPEMIAPFWAAATGWPVLGRDDQGVWLATTKLAAPTWTCTASASPRRPSCGCTWMSHPSPTTTTAPRSHASARSAPSRATSAKATSAGSCLPIPRATNSASSPLADRTGGGAANDAIAMSDRSGYSSSSASSPRRSRPRRPATAGGTGSSRSQGKPRGRCGVATST
jgi:hypothetical protein